MMRFAPLANLTVASTMVMATISFLWVSCKSEQAAVTTLKDDNNKSGLMMLVDKRAGSELAKLVIAAPKELAVLKICHLPSGQTCVADSLQYNQVPSESVEAYPEQAFFVVNEFDLSKDSRVVLNALPRPGQTGARTRVFNIRATDQTPSSTENLTSRGSGGTLGELLEHQPHSFQQDRSEYRVWAPRDNGPKKAHRLVVYLHGDTGSNYGLGPAFPNGTNASGVAAFGQPSPTIDQARREAGSEQNSFWNQTIFVAIFSPATNGSFATWSSALSNQQRDRNAAFVHDLIQSKIIKSFNVDLQKIYFVGQSGGAVFLSSSFVPRHANEYKGGGAISLCGGLPPRPDINFVPAQGFADRFKLHFYTTTGELEHNLDASMVEPSLRSQYRFDSIIPIAAERYGTLVKDPQAVTYRKETAAEIHPEYGGHCIFPEKSQPTIIKNLIAEWETP